MILNHGVAVVSIVVRSGFRLAKTILLVFIVSHFETSLPEIVYFEQRNHMSL